MRNSLLKSFLGICFLFSVIAGLSSCEPNITLPYYGKFAIKTATGFDTVYKTIPPFEFYNQDSTLVTNETFENSIYIADFFFTACPSICPIMKRQMIRIVEAYPNNEEVKLLSHTIDPENDNVAKLKRYADKLEIDSKQWHLVTGYKDQLYLMAEEYMISAYEDGNVPGGFEHSGQFILIDKEGKIRGYYDGTSETATTQLIKDLQILLDEK